ncbi:MAG: glycosyltransferase [uncultured bacterium]|nr:MAG: glycosyltransferase [uncultured bacterium]
MKNNKIIAILITILFFGIGIFTLPDYGINWDTINHLPRGQVYLHYFLTGNKNYSDLPPYFSEWQKKGEWYWQKDNTLSFQPDIPKNSVPRLSLYQKAGVDFNYFMEKDGGHPPLSDILSSVFNLVLFQKLGLINDVDSYRIYGIFLVACLVGLIYYWVSIVYGKFAGLISSLSLSLYPFFWSESHFNTEKDIPETAFWTFFLFSIWQGVRKKSWKWILLSGLFFGLALGTKFNILFVGFVILPWIFFTSRKLFIKRWFVLSSFGAFLSGLIIFISSWPFLWADPITRIQKVIGFYKGIGLDESTVSNTYPIMWILYSTPIIILILSIFGLFSAVGKVTKEKNSLSLLAILWLLVPIIRVTWPGTVIYGGIRQIMEYIPALSILAGLGGLYLYDRASESKKVLVGFLIIFSFIPITLKMISIHPNENVYFNSLIGGLSGAKENNFPFWGNTFGAAYRQATIWINNNAEPNANVVYAYELIPNIPRIWLRTDLNFHNSNRSGFLRKGEYAITLPYKGTENRSYYDMYLRKFLNPVYEAKVDGVSVVTVWKNEDKYLKKQWIEKYDNNVKLRKDSEGVVFDMGMARDVSRLEISYNQNSSCVEMEHGRVRISVDGKMWQDLPGSLPQDWLISSMGKQPKDGKFVYPFTGQNVRFVNLFMSPSNNCLKNIINFKLYYFSD